MEKKLRYYSKLIELPCRKGSSFNHAVMDRKHSSRCIAWAFSYEDADHITDALNRKRSPHVR